MRLKSTLVIAISSMLFFTLCQCTFSSKESITPATITPQQLAADSSFSNMAVISNDFQSIVYNKIRNAHSQKVRKFVDARCRNLLHYENRDSVMCAMKLLGFTDLNALLLSLEKINKLNYQLKEKEVFLDKIPLSTIADAYALVSKKEKHVYPPIKTAKASGRLQKTTDYNTGICELCFLNNCDECSEFGGGSTQLETPNHDNGGGDWLNPCQDGARKKREGSINSANAWLLVQLTAECGTVAWGAGAAACSGTAVTIVGTPISPAVGVGVGCVVYVGCDMYQVYQYRQQIQIIEGDYAMSMAGCK